MDNIRYVLAAILGFFGLYLFFGNWYVFFIGFIKRKNAPSWVPLFSAILLCVAILLIPNNPYRWLCWVPFIIDWGSLPGITTSIIWLIIDSSKERR